MEDKNLMTLEEGAKYLDIGRTTLYYRLKEKGIKPANYNPMRKRQKEPRYSKMQLDALKASFFRAA